MKISALVMILMGLSISSKESVATGEEEMTFGEIIEEFNTVSDPSEFSPRLQGFSQRKWDELIPSPPRKQEDYAEALSKVMTMPSEELFWFANYQGKVPQEYLGKNIKLGESEARMAVLEVTDNLQNIIDYYAAEFERRGIVPVVNQLKENSVYFSHRGQDGFMRTITLVFTDHRTIVLAAVSDAEKVYESFVRPKDTKDSFVLNWREPTIEQGPLALEQKERGVLQQTRQIMVKGTSSGQVLSYYVRELTMAGWRLENAMSQRLNISMAVFVNDRSRCSVIVQPSIEEGLYESMTMCQTITME